MSQGFGDVALLGLGASTQAVGAYLASLPAGAVGSLTVYAGACDDAATRERAVALEALGARVVFGTEELEGGYDLVVPSPGIPATSPFYRSGATHGAQVVSEPELAWRESPRNWAAVVGTNGKTTTTSLARTLLEEGGVPARAVGNIGLPPISCVEGRAEDEVFVAELSSFQLHSCRRFAPRAAALLNVTPDHLEWHGSFEEYAASKERVFQNMGPRDLCLVGDDPVCAEVGERLRMRGLRVAVLGAEPAPCAHEGAWIGAGGRLTVRLHGRDHVLCPFDEMRLKGPHNALNALAAAAIALELGADEAGVVRGLRAFEPLSHRVEPCGVVGGVAFFDDSKGTNVDATLKALAAFEPGRAVVMLGGHDKGTDLAPLARAVAGRCKAAVAYGAAGPRIHEALRLACDERAARGEVCAALLQAPRMREAFDAACALAAPADAVLLSPACSSFDEFSSYKERGDAFKAWVAQRACAAAQGASC